MEKNQYDTTVSASKEESLLKAIEIFEQELKKSERKIERPQIKGMRILCFKLLRAVGLAAIVFGAYALVRWTALTALYGWLIGAAAMIIFLCFTAKSACCEWILLYQRFAPERIRRSCVFEPSCSEYMLLAIKKYGTIKGIIKGIGRLFRCHYPNGGVDYP